MTSLIKTGVFNASTFTENSMSDMALKSFNAYNGGSISGPSSGQYTIVSPVTSSSWGSGISLAQGQIVVPKDCLYRVMLEVYVPSAHTIVVDINNTVGVGSTWNGNDNDLTSTRTATTFSIAANTWTTITWGSSNAHASNTDGVDILPYDGIGLRTSDDSASTTWNMRNPRFSVFYNQRTNAGVDASTAYALQFVEC